MKKVLFFVAVLAAASFASCKKDHVCTCTSSPGSTTASVTTYPSSTKKAAQSNCLSHTDTYSGVVVTTTCTLN